MIVMDHWLQDFLHFSLQPKPIIRGGGWTGIQMHDGNSPPAGRYLNRQEKSRVVASYEVSVWQTDGNNK